MEERDFGWISGNPRRVNMVFHAADDDGLAIVVGQIAAKIAVQFFARRFVAKKWPPAFRRENRVDDDFGERWRHGGVMRQAGR